MRTKLEKWNNNKTITNNNKQQQKKMEKKNNKNINKTPNKTLNKNPKQNPKQKPLNKNPNKTIENCLVVHRSVYQVFLHHYNLQEIRLEYFLRYTE